MKILHESLVDSVESDRKKLLRSWTNQKTNRGFTALHFASFNGNIEMIEFLAYKFDADLHT